MTGSPSTTAFIQGVQTPNVVVAPQVFAAYTRRLRFAAQAPTAINFGSVNSVQLKKTGVISCLEVRVFGNVVIGGTIGTTTMNYEWPYNLLKQLKLSVNGQSTLIDARGLDLKVNEYMSNREIDDRGVSQRIGATTAVTQGTLSLNSDNWGATGAASNYMAPGTTVAAIATYPIDFTFTVPIAADQVTMIGSIFGQSQATNINCDLAWAAQADIFSALGGSATASFTGVNFDVTAVAYSIPVVQGNTVVPDLSNLHGLNHYQQGITAAGESEFYLPGTGAGRYLLRVHHNVYTTAAPAAVPLAVNSTNFANLYYKYGANDVPEIFPNGQKLRAKNERDYNTDIGVNWGFACHDFTSQYAARDVIDLGATSDFRIVIGLVSTPTAGAVHFTMETMFAAAVGA